MLIYCRLSPLQPWCQVVLMVCQEPSVLYGSDPHQGVQVGVRKLFEDWYLIWGEGGVEILLQVIMKGCAE